MARKQTRKDVDPVTAAGFGTPFHISLAATAQPVGATTGLYQVAVPLVFDNVQGKAITLSEVQIHIANLGTGGASGANTYALNKVDALGNIISTLKTIAPAYNANFLQSSLLDASLKGMGLKAGEILRLDFISGAGGLSVQPSGIRVNLFGTAISCQG